MDQNQNGTVELKEFQAFEPTEAHRYLFSRDRLNRSAEFQWKQLHALYQVPEDQGIQVLDAIDYLGVDGQILDYSEFEVYIAQGFYRAAVYEPVWVYRK